MRRFMSEICCRKSGNFCYFIRDCLKWNGAELSGSGGGSGRAVFYSDEDLEQIQLDEDVEDGIYFFQIFIDSDYGVFDLFYDDGNSDEWGDSGVYVVVMGICEADEGCVF